MQKEETLKKIRLELNRLVGTSFIRPNIALTAIMRRKGAGDYRVAIDDAAILSALGAITAELKQLNRTMSNVDLDTDNLAGIKAEVSATKVNTATTNDRLTDIKTDTRDIKTAVDSINTNTRRPA
jgi:hypothetical protein|nr:MAG TPA: hypothetical protein [Caudoviricetes sp.]